MDEDEEFFECPICGDEVEEGAICNEPDENGNCKYCGDEIG